MNRAILVIVVTIVRKSTDSCKYEKYLDCNDEYEKNIDCDDECEKDTD